MRTFVTSLYCVSLFVALAAPAEAGLKQTGRWTLECDGKGTSCQSLKTACTNGGATYEPLKGGGGKCTVGASAGASIKAKNATTAKIKAQSQQVKMMKK